MFEAHDFELGGMGGGATGATGKKAKANKKKPGGWHHCEHASQKMTSCENEDHAYAPPTGAALLEPGLGCYRNLKL